MQRGFALAALVVAVIALPACSSQIADLPSPVGLPTATPARAANPPAFPAVHDMPPPRATTTLSEDEKSRIERDLVAARDRFKDKPKKGKKRRRASATRAQPAGSNPNP